MNMPSNRHFSEDEFVLPPTQFEKKLQGMNICLAHSFILQTFIEWPL